MTDYSYSFQGSEGQRNDVLAHNLPCLSPPQNLKPSQSGNPTESVEDSQRTE
jgi:hypothetical protein